MQIGRAPKVYITGGPEKFLMVDEKTPGPRQGVAQPTADDDAQRTARPAAAASASPDDGAHAAARAKKRGTNVKDHIGRQLRALYDEVASQPVPDRFMELLNRLDVKRGEE